MADPFLLTLPIAAEFRALAPEMAARYVELAGGTAEDGTKASAEVTGALETITREAGPDAAVAVSFTAGPDGVLIDLRCGSRTATVHRAVVPQP